LKIDFPVNNSALKQKKTTTAMANLRYENIIPAILRILFITPQKEPRCTLSKILTSCNYTIKFNLENH